MEDGEGVLATHLNARKLRSAARQSAPASFGPFGLNGRLTRLVKDASRDRRERDSLGQSTILKRQIPSNGRMGQKTEMARPRMWSRGTNGAGRVSGFAF